MASGTHFRTLTPEEAEALLPELKDKTRELLGKMRDAQAEAGRKLSEEHAGDIETAWKDEEFRRAVYERRRYAFDWGEFVSSIGMQPVPPGLLGRGEVIATCTDGKRIWREGDEGYSLPDETGTNEEK